MSMNKIGLVLAGGGGKGAYQIGVWKYLRECGLDQYICKVSGTSVGALNAALFCAGDYEAAESIWLKINPLKILTPRITLDDALKAMIKIGIVIIFSQVVIAGVMASALPLANKIIDMIGTQSRFSREGLLKIMDQNVNFENIIESKIPCYVTCFQIGELQTRVFDLRKYSISEMKDILLASSAIPVIFDPVKVQGEYYYDGGIPILGDNVPIEPLCNKDIDTVIVVHLDRESYIDRKKYEGVCVIEIVPKVDLGGPVGGTLDFTRGGAAWRIAQGYKDAKKYLDHFGDRLKDTRQQLA